MKSFLIKVPNLEVGKIIVGKLYSLGYKWVGDSNGKDEVLARACNTYKFDLAIYSNAAGELSYGTYPWYTINSPYRNSPTISPTISLEDLFTQVSSRVIIDLAPGATATVGEEDVIVKFGAEEYIFTKEQIKSVAALFITKQLPDLFKVLVYTKPLARVIESRLFELGCEWTNSGKNPLSDFELNRFMEPGFYIRCNGKFLAHGSRASEVPILQVSDLFETKSVKSVQLSAWEVTLDGDNVKVGCKTLKKDAVLKLIELCDTK